MHVGVSTQPRPNSRDEQPLFTMPIVRLLLALPEVALHVIRQCEYGAKAIKPTGLLTLRIGGYWKSMQPWKRPTAEAEIEVKIGRYRDGSFPTSELKEYPEGLSWSLAQCIADSLLETLRKSTWRSNLPLDDLLREWCDKIHLASAVICDNAPILPDYQER